MRKQHDTLFGCICLYTFLRIACCHARKETLEGNEISSRVKVESLHEEGGAACALPFLDEDKACDPLQVAVVICDKTFIPRHDPRDAGRFPVKFVQEIPFLPGNRRIDVACEVFIDAVRDQVRAFEVSTREMVVVGAECPGLLRRISGKSWKGNGGSIRSDASPECEYKNGRCSSFFPIHTRSPFIFLISISHYILKNALPKQEKFSFIILVSILSIV